MKAYLFIFLFCPVIFFAQSQQSQTANGSTECPTFGKKNNFSKAGLFQYMRTHKPQRVPDQQSVYRTSALPDLQQAQEQRDLAMKNQIPEKASSRKQRKERNKPLITEEPEESTPATKAVAKTDPVKEEVKRPIIVDPEKADEEQPVDSQDNKGIDVKDESVSTEATGDEAREKREKKVKRAAFKAKTQHLFKRTKKPTSRKNVQKCPTF